MPGFFAGFAYFVFRESGPGDGGSFGRSSVGHCWNGGDDPLYQEWLTDTTRAIVSFVDFHTEVLLHRPFVCHREGLLFDRLV